MDTTSKTPDIVILTTAVDRPELHIAAFQSYIRYVADYNVYWVITVNKITDRIRESESTLRGLLKNHNIYIKTFDTGGSRLDWYNAVKYCINYAKTLKPNIGYLWLEDDWLVNQGMLQEDVKLLTNPNTHVSLAGRTEVSFNPSIWGHDAFEHLMYNAINNPENSIGKRYIEGIDTNPERICCPHPESTNFVHNVATVNRFIDIGRNWQKQHIRTRTFNLR